MSLSLGRSVSFSGGSFIDVPFYFIDLMTSGTPPSLDPSPARIFLGLDMSAEAYFAIDRSGPKA